METVGSPGLWLGFFAFVGFMLALDLGVFHKNAHEITLKESAIWSTVWVSLAAVFCSGVYLLLGSNYALEFATGFLIEKALAVDNIFVFVVIFAAFGIPLVHQHRVLFWGILGALVMRGACVLVGGAFLQRFHWAIYVFGGVLALTGIKLILQRNAVSDPSKNIAIRLFRRVIPVSQTLDGGRFFTKLRGRWVATPLFMALLAVEVTDLIFAVDSIPAVFAITKDPFIVFTSNIFAILGLRSLYFLLAGVIDRFHLLKLGLAAVLIFVGAKMMLLEVIKLPIAVSLGVIAALLGGSIVASLVWPKLPKSDTVASKAA